MNLVVRSRLITTAHRSKGGQFTLAVSALHGNPYDGHTLKSAIDEYEQTTGVKTQRIYVDKGYRGHDLSLKLNIYKSGQKRLAPAIKKEMKRRTAIEPVIWAYEKQWTPWKKITSKVKLEICQMLDYQLLDTILDCY